MIHTARLLLLLSALALCGCWGSSDTPNPANATATPKPVSQRDREALRAAKAAERRQEAVEEGIKPPPTPRFKTPLGLVAWTGSKPNIVIFNVFNQTSQDIPLSEVFFGLVVPPARAVRPFRRGEDWAKMGGFVVPANGMAQGTIEWVNVPPLTGKSLVFFPEPLGFQPVRCIIESAPQRGR